MRRLTPLALTFALAACHAQAPPDDASSEASTSAETPDPSAVGGAAPETPPTEAGSEETAQPEASVGGATDEDALVADNGEADDDAHQDPQAPEAAPTDPATVAAVEVNPETGEPAAPCGEAPAGMACVPGGWMIRGIDDDPHACDQMGMPHDAHPSASPAARIWVDTFYMDTHEVTYGAYHACADAGACEEVRTIYRDHRHNPQPMTGGSWYDAVQYCEAIGGHLPTEAEWELAARGHAGERTSFGDDDVSCDNAIVEDERGRSCGVPQAGSHPDKGRVADVGSLPAGRYGLFDMMGNAEEWVFDWWSTDYDACGEACLGANPRGPCDGAEECRGHRYRVIRGGSWYWTAEHATGYHRRRHYPSNDPYHHFGFRCAATPDEATAGITPYPTPEASE